jgi:hypothetical protein
MAEDVMSWSAFLSRGNGKAESNGDEENEGMFFLCERKMAACKLHIDLDIKISSDNTERICRGKDKESVGD